jgi:hypothetical protein
MPTPHHESTTRRRLLTATLALIAASLLATAIAPHASASTRQRVILQDRTFATSPATSMPLARSLGARVVRVSISWYSMAPNHNAKHKPGVNLSSPGAYPTSKWAQYDTMIRDARANGLTVALQLTGGPPRWARGANPPAKYRSNPTLFGWKPNATLYGQFVHAVAQRYDGHFRPSGASSPLPAVRFWSFWNEPNNGTDLGPQTTAGSTVPVAPAMYRTLLNAAWKAVHQTGHGHDTLLIGELDPLGNGLRKPGHGGGTPGVAGVIGPLSFVRALYCVDNSYRPLTGTVARSWGCPTSKSATRHFRAANPALFDATGFADHPYSLKQAPAAEPASVNGNYTTFPVLSRLTAALDKATRSDGSHKRFPIYNTEFGFITRPPSGKGFPSPAKAAIYLNQAEYLSYKNPRLATYDQYLLNDPEVFAGRAAPGFNTGLYTSKGKPKATVNAFRLPLWMPATTVHAGTRAEIWGGARPATLAGGGARRVSIEMQRGGHGDWTTIGTAAVAAQTGYFDIHMKLPYSGRLRLAYTYPTSEPLLPTGVAGSTIYGRTAQVKVTG